MAIAAQISVYPRQAKRSPAINAAVDAFRARKIEVMPGPMSSVVTGEDEVVFTALRDAFQAAAGYGEVVMVVTLSNACPILKKG